MTTYTYAAGTSVAFNPLADTVSFTSSYDFAASLQYRQVGADLQISVGFQFMTLLNTSFADLASSNLVFANGSLFIVDSADANNVTGSTRSDFIDLSAGGSDSVNGGLGNDVFNIGAELDSAGHQW
jgi:hypothetical protein